MTNEITNPKEKKLKTLRKILWLCFAGVSIPIIVLISAVLLIFGVQNSAWIAPGPDGTPMSMIPFMILSPFLMIGFVGFVMLVIYAIFKYRIEKDDEMFL
jgi:hypothetical protein